MFKRMERRGGGGGEEEWETWQEHRTQGRVNEGKKDPRHVVMELCRQKEGWQRKGKRQTNTEQERSVCISRPQGSSMLRWGNGPWDSYNVFSAATDVVNPHTNMSTFLNKEPSVLQIEWFPWDHPSCSAFIIPKQWSVGEKTNSTIHSSLLQPQPMNNNPFSLNFFNNQHRIWIDENQYKRSRIKDHLSPSPFTICHTEKDNYLKKTVLTENWMMRHMVKSSSSKPPTI